MSTNFAESVTALILTHNEAANIGRVLAKLEVLRQVIVIDSGSDDETPGIVARHANAKLVVRPFDNHAAQWNFGLTASGIATEWVLALDADYLLSDALVAELAGLAPGADVAGYRAQFRYCIVGEPIRCGIYPPVVVLYRRSRAHYVQQGHTQRLVVDGRVADLKHPVLHDDRKPLARWLEAQKNYARLDADRLQDVEPGSLRWQDRVRLLIGVAPPLALLHVLLIRGGIRDGRRGLYYALQRAYAELLLSLELLERMLRRDGKR
jgi:glycosyltransferase involved in cell wall biosynthesis